MPEFIGALKSKKMKPEQLSPAIQKGIADYKRAEEFISEQKERLKDKSLSEAQLKKISNKIKNVEERLPEQDTLLVKQINRFDPVKYQERADHMRQVSASRTNNATSGASNQKSKGSVIKKTNPPPEPEKEDTVVVITTGTPAAVEENTFEQGVTEEAAQVQQTPAANKEKKKSGGAWKWIVGVAAAGLSVWLGVAVTTHSFPFKRK
jgi:hypothetical protein